MDHFFFVFFLITASYAEQGTLTEPEPEFMEPISNISIPLGRDAQLPCIVDNLGTYRAAWIKVESKAILTIHHHIITRNYRISLSHSDNKNFVLHIRNVQISDRGTYMCQVNTVPMKSQVAYLDILIPPDIIVNESSSDITEREGANVSLNCKAKGYPEPTISWRREDNEPISLDMWKHKKLLVSTYKGVQLNITKLNRLHTGAYLCIASNGVPPSVSRRIMLYVSFPPVIWIPNQLIGVALGKDITLQCNIEAFPLSMNYWAKDGKDMIVANEKYDIETREDIYKIYINITIHNLDEKDFGTYKCIAKNPHGSTEGSIKVYEIPPPTEEPIKTTLADIQITSEAFPRHQRFGAIEHLVEEITEVRSSPSTDSKYQISENTSIAEDKVPQIGKSRKRLDRKKTGRSSGSPFSESSCLKLLLLLTIHGLLM